LKDGISPEAFEATRGFLLGYTRLWEQTDLRRLGYAIDSVFYGTPGFLDEFRKALQAMTPEQVSAAARKNLSSASLNFAFVTQDAKGLAEALKTQPPSPIRYPTPKPAEVLETDKKIEVYKLPIDPAKVRVEDSSKFMEQ
jgi:zinc protease